MEGARSGGLTEAGTKASSEMASKAAMGFCTETGVTLSTKAPGTTVCSMARALSSSRMARNTKAHSSRINFTETGSFTKMTRSSMGYGKITSSRW